jgi:hypothetical protein
MVFVLARSGGAVRAYLSPAEAVASCEEADVRAGAWRFFADDGSPLEARFGPPARQAGPADVPAPCVLQRAMSGLWLQERLEQVSKVGGCGLATVADLVETLKVNRSKRVPPPTRRG